MTDELHDELAAALEEFIDAMRRYEMDVDDDPPGRHRDMMDRGEVLIHRYRKVKEKAESDG